MHKVIVIGGGSFQGKSTVALHVAHKLKIPIIICTDAIRNVLRILNPKVSYLSTSTYLMLPEDLYKQTNEVSYVLQEILSIYEIRGESIIIEGMHLSQNFLAYLANKNNILSFCLDNQLPFEKRLKYKSTTRNKTEYFDPKTGVIKYESFKSDILYSVKYKKHANRITEIHREIVQNFLQEKFPIIMFKNINTAMKKIDTLVMNWLKKLNA